MATIRTHSRLRFSRFRYIDGYTFWDLVEIPKLEAQSDDITHVVTATDRPDTISYRYYGNTVMFPIIASVNNIELIPSDMYIGQKLRIPSPRYITEEVFPKKSAF